ncbi:MAG: hypothetical protein AAGL17_25515, partial [Cyanobacteria bacterium J06576_12]
AGSAVFVEPAAGSRVIGRGFNEGAAKADNPFSQLRQQLSASKPRPITLLPAAGSTNTALPAASRPSA